MALELLTLKCASCGASLDSFHGQNEVKCNHCGNTTRVLRPVQISNASISLSESESVKFMNLISILEKSMIAGNYREAYTYCNKALEIDPNSAQLWENKAICSFWITDDKTIINSHGREILTYLNAAKHSDANSPTYKEVASAIAANIFISVYCRYVVMSKDVINYQDQKKSSWSENAIRKMITYLDTMDVCFQIDSSCSYYLEDPIKELSGYKKIFWIDFDKNGLMSPKPWCSRVQFDPIKTREGYIQKLKKEHPSYLPPIVQVEKKSGYCFVATATMGDYDHPIVIQLRDFRDKYLEKTYFGRKFIQFYYKFGPYPAGLIERSFILKRVSYYCIIRPLSKIVRFFFV